ncbi:MAG: SDR family NAD(P)-dependent oxidoreductase [Xanthomonadales bacterium]|nr:SDR family NAD(P)-dependent oxidoreductase [Xanthomonadales bacterium]
MTKPVCAIVGIGPKNGAAFARTFSDKGYALALMSRSTDLSEQLAVELGDTRAYACDAGDPESVTSAFNRAQEELGSIDVLIYNAGSGSWKNVEDITTEEFDRGWRINARGALIASQQVIPEMKNKGAGSIVFVGATASLRGAPMTAGFAPAKAAQRILAQSMAKHLGPHGIHVSVLIIDGQIGEPDSEEVRAGTRLDPGHIAEAAFQLTAQPPSAWSFEVDLRPMREKW